MMTSDGVVRRPNDRVLIFDTTLRDGEQSPGATLSSAEKLEIARQLALLGVDVIEAGFPAASPDDLSAVQRIAREVGNAPTSPIICGLARAMEKDILACWDGVKDAAKPRIHTFLGTSDIHLQYQTGFTRTKALEVIRTAVTLARSVCADVEFSPMDAGRTDPAFLLEVCALAIACGATTINIPDTVGYVTPQEWYETIAGLIAQTAAGTGDEVIWSVHCHNDLGLATANSLAGVMAGARQVEVTINGIGERAGNTSLEEVVMALQTRRAFYGLRTGINTREIVKTSRMVSNYTGMSIQPNKAIVGSNAFAHEAGIHQDGMLKHASTYEIMTPDSVGWQQSRLVLGKHSGRHALKVRLRELGHEVDGDRLNHIFARFKDLADAKKHVTDADLEALMTDEMQRLQEVFRLEDIQVTCGTMGMPTATAKIVSAEGEHIYAAVGTGPVDAAYRAIDAIVQRPNTLIEYSVHSVTEGIDALGEVTVRIALPDGTRSFGGYGADGDIIVASVKAYLAALNRMLVATGYGDSKPEGDAATVAVGSTV